MKGTHCHLGRRVFMMFLFCRLVLSGAVSADASALRIAVSSLPGSLNFFGATDIGSKRALGLMHMPLYIHDPRDGKMIPWLAESPPVMGDRPEKVTIRLRKARWDDGSLVTADDLAFTVRVIQELKVPAHFEKWQIVKDIKKLDERTIQFTLKTPSPTFMSRTLFSSFVQKKAWAPLFRSVKEDPAPLQKLVGYRPGKVVSNGPFSMTRAGTPFLRVLKANPYFFAKGKTIEGLKVGPYIETIFLNAYPDYEQALAGLRKGDLDFIWSDVPIHHLRELEQRSDITLHRSMRSGYDYLAFNLNRMPFSDPSFRRALSLLVERARIIRKALKHDGEPVYSVIPPRNAFWCNSGIQEPGHGLTYDERLGKARKILVESGYTWSNGALVLPDGRKMSAAELLVANSGHRPDRLKTARMVQRWLRDMGVSSSIRMQPMDEAIQRLRSNSFDIYIMGWAGLSDDPDYLRTFFHSQEAEPLGKNYPRFRNREFDDLAERASVEMDPAKRRKLVFDMQNLIARERPYLPLYAMSRTEAVRKDGARGWIRTPGGIGNLWSFLNLKMDE